MRSISCGLLLALSLGGHQAEAAVYKCTDPAGKVTYQAQACADDVRYQEVTMDAGPAARPAASPRQVAPSQDAELSAAPPAPHVLSAGSTPAMANRSGAVPAAPRPAVLEMPRVRLSFDLLSVDGIRLPWTNIGPKDGKRYDGVVRGGAAVMRENGVEAYAVQGGTLGWMPKGVIGPVQELQPPSRLPRMSSASALAWDSRQNVLAIVSMGGEGFFYRYDTARHVWLDARSLQNRDLVSLAFDAVNGTYVAISTDDELVVFNGDGVVKHVRPLLDLLPGASSFPPAERLFLVARGGVVAVCSVRHASVTHIWTYDSGTNRAQLTYKL